MDQAAWRDARLSVVIPVYNAEATVVALVTRLGEALAEVPRLQVVLVDDGSRDRTAELCRGLAERPSPLVTFVSLARNFGEHNAVMAGLHHATGDWVVVMDDDFQDPPDQVPRLVAEAVARGWDVTFARPSARPDPLLRVLGSRFANLVADLLLPKPRGLYLASFKCVSRFAVDQALAYRGPLPYLDGLLLRATDRVGSVEVRRDERRAGRSGYSLGRLVRLWLAMSSSFSVLPLRLASVLGLVFCALGLGLAVAAAVERLFFGAVPLGWASLLVAVTTFSGLQLLILGIAGEYLGSLVLTVNATPQFVVRSVHGRLRESEPAGSEEA